METTDMAAPPLTEGGTTTYRELNRDKTRLPRWMDDMMHRRPRWASDAYNDAPSSVTEGVRTQRARHAAVFEELRRQVRVHSPQLARLLGKVWLGEDELVKKLCVEADKVHDTIVSSQKERNELLKQSKKALSIVERQLSDVKYELAVSKATLREREAECASNKSLVESLNEELGALREQVGKYVEGHVDDIGDRYEALKAERMKLMTEEDPTTGEAYPLAEIERLAKNRLQGVFEMNDEVDEILAKCQRSHDSLKHGLRDLTGLVASVDPDDFRVSKSYKLKKKPSTEVGCQHVTIKVEGVRVNKSLPPPRVEEPVEEGLTMPLLLRKQMCEFPPSQRIPSLQATLRLILSLYLEKLMYDKLCDANHKRRVELGAFPHKYLLKKFGLQNLADEQCTQLVAAVAYHKDESKRVRLFGEYLGMTDFAKPPIYGVRDGNFVFGILVALRKANEFTEAVLQDKDQQIDINRKKAVDVMRACFKPILPDQGAKLLHRVQNLPPPSVSRNPKCIDLDDLLELTHNTWANTSSNWRTHLEFLYARHANLYRVKEEMRFANDNGILSQDVILVQEERAKNYTLRDARRPLYDLQQQGDVMTQLMKERASMDDDDLHGKKRPELVAAMPFEAFDACIREIDPYVEENDIRRIFDDCKKLQTHRIETSFRELWVRHELVDGVANINQPETEEPTLSKLMRGIEPSFETTRKMKALPRMKSPKKRKEGFDVPRAEDPEDPHAAYFWYSKEFETSVWVPPWDPKLFDVQEVERDVFLEVCLDEFLLPNSPFNSLLDKLPTDLWPNAEAYLEQLEGGETLF
mmetsp:Transcript_7057/g.18247  ORF Transcript_7057/g.18247 Transcript_7057/m.18247 type:complete len:809 (-) Transcript_7057:1159-3585(-)